MPRWLKWTLMTVALVVGLLLLSMLVVPWQIKQQSHQWIAANTTRTLAIERVFFNPFTLKLELNGLLLTEQRAEQPFLSFDRLLLSVSGQSLLRRALILNRLELDNPFVNIELLDEQLFNFSDFIPQTASDEPAQSAPEQEGRPFHFSLNNIVVTGGRIDFVDRTARTDTQHQIRELSFSVPFVGNIPYLVDEYVEPQLQLLINGAELAANGQLRPFHDSLETRLQLQLTKIDLPFYAYHSPLPLPVRVEQGELDLELDLVYRVSRTEQPQLILGGLLMLTEIDLREPDGAELLRLPLLVLDLDWANLFQRDFALASLELYDPQLWIDRDAEGLWNFEKLLTSIPQETSEAPAIESVPAADSEPPLFFAVARAVLVDGAVRMIDRAVAEPVSEYLYPINLKLTNLTNHPNRTTGVALRIDTDRQTELEAHGRLSLNPVGADIGFALRQLPLRPYYPYLSPWLTQPLSGVVALTGTAEYSAATNLRLQQLNLSLRDLLIPFDQEDRLKLDELSISAGSIDLQQQQIMVGEIVLSGADLSATRLADGNLSPLLLLREQAEEKGAADIPAAEEGLPQWSVTIEDVGLRNTQLALTDATLAARPQLLLRDVDLKVGNLHYPEAQVSPCQLAARIGQRGEIKIGGTLIYAPLQVQAQVDLKAFPLAAFNDFIPPEMRLVLSDGQLDTDLTLAMEDASDALRGTFGGELNISHFGLRDPFGGGDLLRWDSLSIQGLNGDIAPLRVHIREVTLRNYLTAIQITPAGQVNVTGFGAGQTAPEEPPAETMTDRPASTPADIRIDALTLQGGTVSFTDRHLPRVFSTTMVDLGGRVSGLRSAPDMLADVDLRGRLENHSPLTIEGKINPLSEDLYLDLKMSFRDIDLTPMTPYSGTYLGYVIDRGKLNLELNYHIENRKIRAANQVSLDQFTLGDTVQSDKATKLPVRLAIALLKDRNEEIQLDIPVSGDLDDPSFSLAGTIFTVLRNLLVRAATAPFSLLTAMLGSDKDFSGVTFAPGIARLDAEQLANLEQLTGVLAARPAFNLEISGFADRDNDPEAYRQEQLRQLLVDTQLRNLQRRGSAPESRDEVVINEENYSEVLLQVYQQATFPRPRNLLGILTKLPDEEMEKLLLAHIVVGDQQLEELARDRALAVRDALETANEEIKARLFLKKTDIFTPSKEGPASRVELGIIPR